MGTEKLAIRSAKKHVKNFREEFDVMREHHEAMDSFDCEAYLQLGIDAYACISWVSSGLHKAIRSGKVEPQALFDKVIETLYRGWLETATGALNWLAEIDTLGYSLPNREKFIECVERVRAHVAELDKMNELAARVPSAADLDLIAADPNLVWKDDPAWTD